MENRKFGSRRAVTVAAVIAVAVMLPVAAVAFALQGRPGVPLQLAKNEIVQGDYITAGDTIDLQGNIDGDVIVVGKTVTIAGAVSGDVIVAANTLIISGEVEGDVRVAGMHVTIDGTIGKNCNVWGADVTLGEKSSIGRNGYVVGQNVSIRGAVGKNLAVRAANLMLGGNVVSDVLAEVGIDGVVTLLPGGSIGGNLTYAAATAEQLRRDPAAKVSGTVRHEAIPVPTAAERLWYSIFGWMVSLFGMLVVGLALINLVPRYVVQLVQQGYIRKPWRSLASGLVVVVATPIVVVVLLFTVIGLPLALILAAFYFVILYTAQVVSGIAIGLLLFNRTLGSRYRGTSLLPMVCGLILYVAIAGMLGPVGWALKMIAVLWGVGALWQVSLKNVAQWREKNAKLKCKAKNYGSPSIGSGHIFCW